MMLGIETALPLLMGCGAPAPDNKAVYTVIANIQSVAKSDVVSAEDYAESRKNLIAASKLTQELSFLHETVIEHLPAIYDDMDSFAAFMADKEKAQIDGIPVADLMVRVAMFNRSASADLIERLNSFKAAVISRNTKAFDTKALQAVDALHHFINQTLYASEQLLTLVSQVTTVSVPAKGSLSDDDIKSLMASSAKYFAAQAS